MKEQYFALDKDNISQRDKCRQNQWTDADIAEMIKWDLEDKQKRIQNKATEDKKRILDTP